jgi:hypothetical protein
MHNHESAVRAGTARIFRAAVPAGTLTEVNIGDDAT